MLPQWCLYAIRDKLAVQLWNSITLPECEHAAEGTPRHEEYEHAPGLRACLRNMTIAQSAARHIYFHIYICIYIYIHNMSFTY